MTEAATSRRLDHLIWTIIAAVAAIVLAAPLVSRFYIEWSTFAAPIGACLALVAGSAFYQRWRVDLRLASGLESTAQLVAFAAVGAPLSYLAAAGNLPLIDHVFDAADRAAGLDWMTLLHLMNAHPLLEAVLRPIYLSLTLQMTLVTLCLAFSGRLTGLRVYLIAFMLSALVTIALSAVLPAIGVWPHYGLTPAESPHVLPAVSTSWPVFTGLRDGTFRALVAVGSEGIITFPSLHAALAVIIVAALWPIRLLRWAILALNILMLAATPIEGSHYFIDVLAGIALAALCLLAARSIAARAGASRAATHSSPGTAAVSKTPQLAAGE